jgi:predicted RNA-binding Zn-ribbon protein involved in translation (DUF1610 family)
VNPPKLPPVIHAPMPSSMWPCPTCGRSVSVHAFTCPGCGMPFRSAIQRGSSNPSNAIAAVASFFIPGLGQLIQGRPGSGILFFLGSVALWLVFMGWIIHIMACIDAASHSGA